MTRVLVLTAVDVEARGLARHLGLARMSQSPWPHFAGGALEIACVGLRASQLRARADRLRPFDLVVSAGACGALAPALSVGDLVVPELVVDAAGQRWPTAVVTRVARAGTLLTVGDVVETAAQKSRLWLATGARAVDMESAAILAWAVERGVPGAVIRAVSDGAGRGIPAALAASIADTAFSDLIDLRAGTEAALKTVASALAALIREA